MTDDRPPSPAGPPSREIWKREPRSSAYRLAYWAHRGQGWAALLALSWWSPAGAAAALIALFVAYQTLEWLAYRAHRDAWYEGREYTPDSPSRDIADFMMGGWAGFIKGAGLHLSGWADALSQWIGPLAGG